MSANLLTYSIFYYGHEVTSDNNRISFDEGAAEINATVDIGSYTLTDFALAVKSALDTAGGQVYTVAVNRTTRVLTISAAGAFTLRVTTGSTVGTTAYTLMGYTSNKTTTTSAVGDAASGSQYTPQFKLQDYISSEDWQQSVDASVNKTASGRVETVSFGTERFVQFNIKYINNLTQDGVVIKTNTGGLADARLFMQNITTKAPFEFMPDIDTRSTYESLLLESTPESSNGTGYKLKESYNTSLRGYFETGILKTRVI